jgi:hypothetical protein
LAVQSNKVYFPREVLLVSSSIAARQINAIRQAQSDDTMSETPSSTVASFIILLTLFFGGGFVGEQLALALAPGSGFARLLGFLALPASFMLGFFVWAGAAAFALMRRFAKEGVHPNQKPREIPPGAIGFLWSSVLSCLFVGALAGLVSKEHGVVFVSGVYVAVGLVYGVLCWQLAKAGWLPFPRE